MVLRGGEFPHAEPSQSPDKVSHGTNLPAENEFPHL